MNNYNDNKTYNNKDSIKSYLKEFGFENEYIDIALSVSDNQEDATEYILRMLEDKDFYNQMKENYNLNKNCSINSNLTSNFDNYKMTLVVRKDLNMSAGKVAAQVAHAALESYKKTLISNPNYIKQWESRNGSAKIVLSAKNLQQLLELKEKAVMNNIPYAVITDAGRTEVEPGSITVLSIGPAPSNIVDSVTGKLDLY